MFSQKLDILMKEMDATNTDVAECAGFDRTNITRFRNGSRFPDPSSRSAIRLIDGLFLYARDRGRLADLCVTPGIDPLETEEKIKHELHEWLYKDDPLLKDGRRNRRGRRKKSLGEEPGDDHFGVRLTEAMKLAEISNISLSRMLNVDPSLISRYRSGMCMPRSESVDPLVDILFRRIGSNEREEELILLMDCKRSD
ncbi:MAG: hypothetical protein IK123_03750, partial [Lachnospiraceae bacterium]|nr:hypothetical protein [Lachnospiraceae bacterium]